MNLFGLKTSKNAKAFFSSSEVLMNLFGLKTSKNAKAFFSSSRF